MSASTTTKRKREASLDDVKQHLQCTICWENYQQPKVLPCGHTFCMSCLEKIAKPNTLCCPSCRQNISLISNELKNLPTNYFINNLVEIIKNDDTKEKTKPTSTSMCEKHKGEQFRLYCNTCSKLICRDCALFDHIKPDHDYVLVKEAAAKDKQQLTELIAAKRRQGILQKQKLFKLEQEYENLNATGPKIISEIEGTFQSIISILEIRKEKLIDAFRSDQRKKLETLLATCAETNAKINELKKGTEMILTIFHTNDFVGMINLSDTISKELEAIKELGQPRIDEKEAFPPLIADELTFRFDKNQYDLLINSSLHFAEIVRKGKKQSADDKTDAESKETKETKETEEPTESKEAKKSEESEDPKESKEPKSKVSIKKEKDAESEEGIDKEQNSTSDASTDHQSNPVGRCPMFSFDPTFLRNYCKRPRLENIHPSGEGSSSSETKPTPRPNSSSVSETERKTAKICNDYGCSPS